MSTDNGDDFTPLQYASPSPYKKRRPKWLSSCKRKSKKKLELNNKIEELSKIEEKYKKRIVENINKRIREKPHLYDDQKITEIIFNSSASGSAKKAATVKDLLRPINYIYPFRHYFSPNCYFHRFNQDDLFQQFFDENSTFRHLTRMELLELIKSSALEIPNRTSEKNNFLKFLLYLGSVTNHVTILKVSQYLEQEHMPFAQLMDIIENWGRVTKQKMIPKNSSNKPSVHNFEFILNKLKSSICRYTLPQIKEVLIFLINVSLDPLFVSLAHCLLQPLKVCIDQLSKKRLQREKVVDLIEHEKWDLLSTLHIVSLLLNCGASQEVGIILGMRVLSNILKRPSPPSIINMETWFQILVDGKDQLIKSDLQTSFQSCLLFELISYRMPNRKNFDILEALNFIEQVKSSFLSEIKSVYFSEIINRMKMMWSLN